MEKKPAHQGLRKDLDRIQTQWDKLKRETVDRYTRLQTAMVSLVNYFFHKYFIKEIDLLMSCLVFSWILCTLYMITSIFTLTPGTIGSTRRH